jgi:hypothetical protein
VAAAEAVAEEAVAAAEAVPEEAATAGPEEAGVVVAAAEAVPEEAATAGPEEAGVVVAAAETAATPKDTSDELAAEDAAVVKRACIAVEAYDVFRGKANATGMLESACGVRFEWTACTTTGEKVSSSSESRRSCSMEFVMAAVTALWEGRLSRFWLEEPATPSVDEEVARVVDVDKF